MPDTDQFMNVKEPWYMYDTVAVSPWVSSMAHPVPGWFSSFANFAASDAHSFFDTRNKSIGIAYNNLESIGQLPYALHIESLSIGFFGCSVGTQAGAKTSNYRGRVDIASPFWDNELPQHASAILRVNQDERLKTNCAMMSPGYGPVGGAYGQGDISTDGGTSSTVHANGMGVARTKFRWDFPSVIGVPRRATISVEVRLVEWAKSVLGEMWGPGYLLFRDDDPGGAPAYPFAYKPSMFIIQVCIAGKREVQQRGQYHA